MLHCARQELILLNEVKGGNKVVQVFSIIVTVFKLFLCVMGMLFCVCLCAMCMPAIYGGRKRTLDPQEPESWVIVSYHVDTGTPTSYSSPPSPLLGYFGVLGGVQTHRVAGSNVEIGSS